MLTWLPDAEAAASTLLLYFGSYGNAHGVGPIQDVARNPNSAQSLVEISRKIEGALSSRSPREPEVLSLNTAILASMDRYRTLPPPPAHGKESAAISRQVEDVYNGLVTTTTTLEQLSHSATLELAPIAAMLASVATMLELALLERLGTDFTEVRLNTAARYQSWFALLLSPGSENSVATALNQSTTQFDELERKLASSVLGPALAMPGTRQAIYCLEHQIGITDHFPLPNGPSLAELYQETWIRLYGVTIITNTEDRGVLQRSIGKDPEVEDPYARVALTDRWYGRGKPPWQTNVDSYDSRNIQGFRGQNTAERVADLRNSPKWRTFLASTWPQARDLIAPSNEAARYLRFVANVYNSIKAAAGASSIVKKAAMAARAA